MSRPELSEVLAEVNRLRGERELEPLTEMPVGGISGWNCPIARAFGGDAANCLVYVTPRASLRFKDTGDVDGGQTLREFIDAFDAGVYPELRA